MPFTLAHPALILPLTRSRFDLSVTGLVMGSIVPDLEFFIQMREVENIGHHWHGILIFDLPAALLMAFFFHNVLRNDLIVNLPGIFRKRFVQLLNFDWNNHCRNHAWKIIFSVLLGILSHLALDAFTHHDGWFVEVLPILAVQIDLWDYSLHVYFILQIVLSVLGLLIVFVHIMQLKTTNLDRMIPSPHLSYWMTLSFVFLGIFCVRIICWPEWNTLGGVMIAIMGSLLYSLLTVSLIFNQIQKYSINE